MIVLLLILASFVVSVIGLVRSAGRDLGWWVWSLLILALILTRFAGLGYL
jgi:quinol-cytochrome oxidoreductase complex cytochrome b subunit